MHEPRKGETMTIKGIPFHLPPRPPENKILGYGLPRKKQKWENVRPQLPVFKASSIRIFSSTVYSDDDILDWDQVRREEIIGQSGHDPYELSNTGQPKKVTNVTPNVNYTCPNLNAFRRKELTRIYRDGVWFYNDGEPTYLTGYCYAYLTYWKLINGLPDYRQYVRDIFYLIEWCMGNEKSLGAVVGGPRGFGKSSMVACVAYFETIKYDKGRCGIQSKSDDDAEKLFSEKLVKSAVELPEFLVPVSDFKISTPKQELKFEAPRRRHPNALYDKHIRKMAKNASIDFRNAKDNAYDGDTLRVMVQDEIGKITDPNDVEERFRISRFCVLRGEDKVGVMLGFSSAGEMTKGGGEKFKKLWEASDYEKNRNGYTTSEVVKFFVSALETVKLDEFGRPQPELARQFHSDKLELQRQKSMVDYYTYLRQNPFEEPDMFKYVEVVCQYNLDILLERQDWLTSIEGKKEVTRGDFVWLEGRAVFSPNAVSGKWEVSWLFPDPKDSNNVYYHEGWVEPLNKHMFSAALDPVSKENPKHKDKASEVACTIMSKGTLPDKEHADTVVADYRYRSSNPNDDYENVLCAAVYYGVPILVENNFSQSIEYYKERGFVDKSLTVKHVQMVQWELSFMRGGAKKRNPFAILGQASNEKLITAYVEHTKIHVIEHGRKLRHIRIVEDWIAFDPSKTTKYDSGVSASLAILAGKEYKQEEEKAKPATGLFKTYRHE